MIKSFLNAMKWLVQYTAKELNTFLYLLQSCLQWWLLGHLKTVKGEQCPGLSFRVATSHDSYA